MSPTRLRAPARPAFADWRRLLGWLGLTAALLLGQQAALRHDLGHLLQREVVGLGAAAGSHDEEPGTGGHCLWHQVFTHLDQAAEAGACVLPLLADLAFGRPVVWASGLAAIAAPAPCSRDPPLA